MGILVFLQILISPDHPYIGIFPKVIHQLVGVASVTSSDAHVIVRHELGIHPLLVGSDH